MYYNNKILQLSNKYKQFLSDKTKGQIIVTICPYTFELDYKEWGYEKRPLSSWDFEHELEAFAIREKRLLEIFLEYTKDLDNDYVPAINAHFGFGAHSAYFSGMPVIMGEETSWTHPFLHDYNDIDRLVTDKKNKWFNHILAVTQHYLDMQDGTYAVSSFSNAGPGDMANAIRGNDLFTDLYDKPDCVHKLLDKCADAIIWLEDELRKMIGYINGGVVTANCWFEGQAPYLSLDFNDLCSEESFKAFDYIACQKVINHFGGAFIHHHAKGYHIHNAIAKLKNLKLLEMSLDPKCLRPIEHLDEIFEIHGDLPLMIRCSAADVYKNIESLKKGRVVVMLNIDSLDQGYEVMRFIRKHSKI